MLLKGIPTVLRENIKRESEKGERKGENENFCAYKIVSGKIYIIKERMIIWKILKKQMFHIKPLTSWNLKNINLILQKSVAFLFELFVYSFCTWKM